MVEGTSTPSYAIGAPVIYAAKDLSTFVHYYIL